MREQDPEMEEIMAQLLAVDADITARAVARLHPTIKAASSITRSEVRSKLLADYQERQREYRRWQSRASKQSSADISATLAKKELRIAELEATVQLLTASHVAMLRAVGAAGGFSKWAQFFDAFKEVRDTLIQVGAVPLNVALIDEPNVPRAASKTPKRKL
ncbi:hypothetical protein BCF11_4877 [Collimonas sp. PA-H2]|uniref:hypothetical protein n=1 Tax=Collimonas sp. PA-H2 TaxID=1881062 RepID=UPI000BF927E7|nr:hypothetical protein [Collimonas sp. PA-H2]PFH12396.1 hypothetical protein BCF11_4877 [Collimonas sp. PA-H2]